MKLTGEQIKEIAHGNWYGITTNEDNVCDAIREALVLAEKPKSSYCATHNTYPAENEPCWSCADSHMEKAVAHAVALEGQALAETEKGEKWGIGTLPAKIIQSAHDFGLGKCFLKIDFMLKACDDGNNLDHDEIFIGRTALEKLLTDFRENGVIPPPSPERTNNRGIQKIREMLCSMHSMINCGEPFSPSDQVMFRDALVEVDKLASVASPERDAEEECENHNPVKKLCSYCFSCDSLEFGGRNWLRSR